VLPARRIVLLLLAAAGTYLGSAQPVAAQEEPDEPSESVQGVLIDRKGTRERDDDEPIEGAEITVTTVDGEGVETVESDEEGRFEIGLPGPGAYTVELNTDTLPEDVGLAEGAEIVTFSVNPGESQRINFQLGARERAGSSKLDRVPQLVFEGVKFGLIIAICAVGLSLIFGTTGLTNFAHGELVTFGAIIAWWINVDHDVPLVQAAVLAMVIGGGVGALNDLALWRPLRRRGMSLPAMMIVSIGLSLAARNLLQLVFGETTRPYNDYVIQQGVDIGPITAAPKDLWIIGIVLVTLVAVALMLQRSKIGKAMRAVSDNPDLAASSGIDVDRVILYVWVAGGMLATLGGVLFAVGDRVQFNMGFQLLLLMFAGITLGGLGTAYGALVGSFVIGMLVQLSTLVVPTELKNVGALLVLILVLLVRPQGILGRAERIG
jgi:branched-chain amino acid transport system permease protein